VALKFGANEVDAVMMKENVASSAVTTFRHDATRMEEFIRETGYCSPAPE
jgi:2-iminoacetate synthase ThiH